MLLMQKNARTCFPLEALINVNKDFGYTNYTRNLDSCCTMHKRTIRPIATAVYCLCSLLTIKAASLSVLLLSYAYSIVSIQSSTIASTAPKYPSVVHPTTSFVSSPLIAYNTPYNPCWRKLHSRKHPLSHYCYTAHSNRNLCSYRRTTAHPRASSCTLNQAEESNASLRSKTEFAALIGIEAHIQLNTSSKAFCGCSTQYSPHLPNFHICPICVGEPGSLPALNREAVAFAIRIASALHCVIDPELLFDRKMYFYNDMPKNYQITQHRRPLGREGYLWLPSDETIPILSVQLEEDSAKILYKNGSMLIDFNRAGMPLVEVVTQARVMRPQDIVLFGKELMKLLQFVGASQCKMEEGSIRCDINVSIHPKKRRDYLCSKVEIKNLNSFKAMKDAAEYEIRRQIDLYNQRLLKNKGCLTHVCTETRYWDKFEKRTHLMRKKQNGGGYLYIEEFDLPPIKLSPEFIDLNTITLLELPSDKAQRFVTQYGISLEDAMLLTDNGPKSNYFEETVANGTSPHDAAKWIINDITRGLSAVDSFASFNEILFKPSKLAEMLSLIRSGYITHQVAKQLLPTLLNGWNSSVIALIQEKRLESINDVSIIKEATKAIIERYASEVAMYRAGKVKLLNFFVGKVMERFHYRANPTTTGSIVQSFLLHNITTE